MTLPVHDSSRLTDDDCGDCHGRRAFLRDALSAAVAFAGLPVPLPIGELSALPRSAPGEVRFPLPSADGVSIDRKNEVILARAGSEVFAFSLACPHQRAALKALPGAEGFQCPRHKSRFEPNGTLVSGRAKRNMDRLPIRRDGEEVVVDPEVAYESDKDPERWAAAMVKL